MSSASLKERADQAAAEAARPSLSSEHPSHISLPSPHLAAGLNASTTSSTPEKVRRDARYRETFSVSDAAQRGTASATTSPVLSFAALPVHPLRAAQQEAQSAYGKNSGRNSGRNTGKHTPTEAPTGDYASYLAATELKARLAAEQEAAIRRDLELAKHPSRLQKEKAKERGEERRGDKASRLRDLVRKISDEQQPTLQQGPTLEERGHFPGDLRHHGHLDSTRPSHKSSEAHTDPGTRRVAHKSSKSKAKAMAPAPCGTLEFSDSEDEADGASDDLLVGSSADESENGDERTKTNAPRGNSQSSSGTSDDEETVDIIHHERDASTISLKSWQGGKGQDDNASGRRMPRWEDFRVPPDEAAVAARQGKRVTVLTHVDRGLQLLAASEGPGGPQPRQSGSNGPHAMDKHGHKKKRPSSGRQSRGAGEAAGESSAGRTEEENTSADEAVSPPAEKSGQPHVTWAPETGFTTTTERELPGPNESPDANLAGLRQRSIEKSEREAKKEDKKQQQSRESKTAAAQAADVAAKADRAKAHDRSKSEDHGADRTKQTDEEPWQIITPLSDEAVDNAASEAQGEPHVDGIAFCIAYILALVERYAPEELDSSPDQAYRESKTRSHIERLYLIAPFWERLLFGLRRLYRWEDTKRTGAAAMIYFLLWYTNLLATAFLLMLMYYILQFRFFPPDASVLHEQVRKRMARGVEADRLAERLRRRSRLDILEIYKRYVMTYGSATQAAAGDIADFHEKVKNLILWRNPTATWRTLTLFSIATALVTFLPTAVVAKILWLVLGVTFFLLLPLQSHYPRYRRPLSPIWWALWGTPTDAQFAIQLLRRRHLEKQVAAGAESNDPALQQEGEEVRASDYRRGKEGRKRGMINVLTPLMRSSAAHAVAYGPMRPLKDGEGGLLSLEDRVKDRHGHETVKPRKLGSFFCQHNAVPGHLHVTTRMIYFVALHHVRPEGSHKSCKTPLEEIAGLVKTKSIRLVVWSSSGLQIQRTTKGSLFFSNMAHRDDAFNLILAIGSEVWSKV
ncbi:Phosphoribosyltransferase C-terminal [Ceraceosorus bombacis]|uniref:Phosphoribosyltransferase C-terminal n=1 Tax=Ceraceosorus bombacis TaxID=401625 RepID=A0A0P1BJL1_9BASI|nr:Phosphoribosyltransferase C-terminal [Ceraceosorus bombacis]